MLADSHRHRRARIVLARAKQESKLERKIARRRELSFEVRSVIVIVAVLDVWCKLWGPSAPSGL